MSGGFLPRYLPLDYFPPEMAKRISPGATQVDLLDLELPCPVVVWERFHRNFNPFHGPGAAVFQVNRDGIVTIPVAIGLDLDGFAGDAFNGVATGIDFRCDVFN